MAVDGALMSNPLVKSARQLCTALGAIEFSEPVAHVYQPLDYAWAVHEAYLTKFGGGPKRVIFLGMNPGPFGMVQTGVPFGEVAAVRDWLGLGAQVAKPAKEHPKRPIEGFSCRRSEVSGRRLWGLFAARFGPAERFFAQHFVANYCPLAFMEASGRNLTPDKLPMSQTARLYAACDAHLERLVSILQPEWLIGVGDFAKKRAAELFRNRPLKVAGILHPSPASPAANRGWAAQAEKQLGTLGVW